jgi:gamma-glutamylcyclotransferase (GGCT)/AIG2-like uncharacterized protein YtfP
MRSKVKAMSMRCNVFTYGSLMFPAVWERVVRGRYRSSEALLENHARYAILAVTYPGMVAQAGIGVEGILYCDVDVGDIARLDSFEGIDYRRTPVSVLLRNGTSVEAQTYLYTAPQRLLDAPWNADRFDIPHFLNTYCPSG